jgi:hypothetical protein
MDQLARSRRPVIAVRTPLAVYTQIFPTGPSTVDEARAFVRASLRRTHTPEPDIGTVEATVSQALTDLTDGDTGVHISVRVFADYVEVDVLRAGLPHPARPATDGDGPAAEIRGSLSGGFRSRSDARADHNGGSGRPVV